MKSITLLIACLFIISCGGGGGSSTNSSVALNLTPTGKAFGDTSEIGLSFPPVTQYPEMEFTLPHLERLNVNKVKYSENWKFREPLQGSFSWGPLDKRLAYISDNNLSLMLTILTDGPDWACSDVANTNNCVFESEDNFRTYISTLLQRYANQISQIQFGSEWDNIDIYPGTSEDYVRFFNIFHDEVKKHSPDTEVVLGGISKLYPIGVLANMGASLTFDQLAIIDLVAVNEYVSGLASRKDTVIPRVEYVLENATYDAVDLYMYDDFENWGKYTYALQQKTTRPIIVSEFGGPHPEFESDTDAYQAEMLFQYLETIKSLPIKDAYYFKLVDNYSSFHEKSGLINIMLEEKPSYEVFMQR